MRSIFENKRLVLLVALLALGALTVLAVSLDDVPFREAEQFTSEETAQFEVYTADLSEVWLEVPIWKQVLLWSLLGLSVLLIGLLLSPETRRKFFLMMIRAAVTVWAVYFVLTHYGDRLLGLNPQEGGAAAAGAAGSSPMPVFEPPQVSPVFSYLVSFAFALLWLVILWVLYRGWRRYQLLNSKKPLDEIASIARSSLNDLSAGRNTSDVIINCYLQMSDVVANKRHLQRASAMTPHEFAVRLEQAGLPGDAVGRLTRLFEGVRYGDRKSGPRDVNEAVSCLRTILNYCGEPV